MSVWCANGGAVAHVMVRTPTAYKSICCAFYAHRLTVAAPDVRKCRTCASRRRELIGAGIFDLLRSIRVGAS